MLYIVGTPIGNLEDLSLRQARTLCESDVILTEDTRSTGLLLKKIEEVFSLSPHPSLRLISYYKEKEFEKLPEILELLHSGKTISLISQAGMPLVSDPGLLLVKRVMKEHIPYTVVPGPTAATTALAMSGVDPRFSMFVGFLPKKPNDIKKLFNKLKDLKTILAEMSFVCYESAQRITNTLSLIDQIFPDSTVVICRELTKKFEEVTRGSAKDLMKRQYKGEITMIIS